MQAYVDGKEIERRWVAEREEEWRSTETPNWFWNTHDYRVKPQPMKVTEEEKSYTEGRMWFKNRHTNEMLFVKPWMINKDNFYVLNFNTMQWEDWNEKEN